MRNLTLAATLLTTFTGLSGQVDTETVRPNIILFLVDDMGWQDTSVPFHTERTPLNDRYRTPNMERLAERGVKFTQAYACAVSSPSRCSLMSGMNAARHRVTNWTLEWGAPTDERCDSLQLPDWNYNGIQNVAIASEHDLINSTPVTPLPELLRENGYYTIHCGKGHFAAQSTSGEDPLNMGFDVNIGGSASGAPGSYLAANEYHNRRFYVTGLDSYAREGIFLTEALTQEALKTLQKPISEGQPFYLYMSHYAIHDPYEPDDRFTDNYRDSDGKGLEDKLLGERLSDQEVNHAALIEGMDKSLGDILDFLDSQPDVAKNTIILFMSDNGGHSIWPRQNIDYAPNYPARSGKGSALMGGVRVPMIVDWPGVTQPGTVSDQHVMIEDYFPTILNIAGVTDFNTVQTIDGISFADVLTNPELRRERPIVWHFPNIWVSNLSVDNGYGAYSALLEGDYHLIHYWNDGSTTLYNIADDISESHDLASEMPELTQDMLTRLFQTLENYQAQIPVNIRK